MANWSHYRERWRAQETAESPFLWPPAWDQEATDGSQGEQHACYAGSGAGHRQTTIPGMGWLYKAGSALWPGLYHDTMPEKSLIPLLSLLAPVEQRRLAV